MSGLDVRVARRVHAGLAIDATIRLGAESGVLFGPSGAGKSTILRMIAGLTRPDSGRVRLGDGVLFDSSSRVSLPLRARRVGLIFQDDLLFPHLTVEGNVRFGLRGWTRREANARVEEVAGLCGVGSLLGRWPATLSGGERQRVGLARALAPRPRLLLCDEPVSALDLGSRHALIDRLKVVRRAEGIPMLTVTHAVDEAVALGDRLFRLSGGRVVAEGPPIDVLAAGAGGPWPSLRNAFPAVVEGADPDGRSSRVRVVDGPVLVVPGVDGPAGTQVVVEVRSDDVVLARGPVGAISARNLLEGRVVRVVEHGDQAEVLVRTGGVTWVVGVVPSAVRSLGLIAGAEVRMIVKARSCRTLRDEPLAPRTDGPAQP